MTTIQSLSEEKKLSSYRVREYLIALAFICLLLLFLNGIKGPLRSVSATSGTESPVGMKWIPAGTFMMGTDADSQARTDEFPAHRVSVNGFWMDEMEVTNAQFAQFVKATGYLTTAEKDVDWEEMKKQLPAATPRPPDSLLMASSLVFTPPNYSVSLNNVGQWWTWKRGADWRHPQGEGSSIEGKENYPVVHISWDDAMAYCQWAGKRLPTEAEWEWAASGGDTSARYPWGNDQQYWKYTNTWNGTFPNKNTMQDGFERSAPVKSFAPNKFGLYDVAGNVWEWCSDWYRFDYYQYCLKYNVVSNPHGPESSYDPDEPTVPKRVNRGGSFLCNDSYCSSYRITARMKTSPDTGLEHLGFRCVMTQEMWEQQKK